MQRTFLSSLTLLIILWSCTHEPIEPVPSVDVQDSLTNPSNEPKWEDPPSNNCDPSKIYFTNYIQKLVVTKCAPVGYGGAPCHYAAYPGEEDDIPAGNKNVRLLTYEDIRSHILDGNDFWDEIDDDKMPLKGVLSQQEKDDIKKWIDEGFQNNSCNDCSEKEYLSFEASIGPLLYINCSGCHNAETNSGTISFFNANPTSSSDINKSKLQDPAFFNRVTGAISRNNAPMPKLANKLFECEYDALIKWKEDGYP